MFVFILNIRHAKVSPTKTIWVQRFWLLRKNLFVKIIEKVKVQNGYEICATKGIHLV